MREGGRTRVSAGMLAGFAFRKRSRKSLYGGVFKNKCNDEVNQVICLNLTVCVSSYDLLKPSKKNLQCTRYNLKYFQFTWISLFNEFINRNEFKLFEMLHQNLHRHLIPLLQQLQQFQRWTFITTAL